MIQGVEWPRANLPLPLETVGIAAYGTVRAPWGRIAELRRAPGLESAISPVRLADEQTVLGVAAVCRAIKDFGWQERSFHDWAVVGAPRYPARVRFATAMARFQSQGVRGVSPLVIPHQSLHSLSGTVTLAIGSRGPNFGVGGGPGQTGEALRAGLALLTDDGPSGVWVVMTEWSPEPIPQNGDDASGQAMGHAVALALAPQSSFEAPFSLQHVPVGDFAEVNVPRVQQLAEYLEGKSPKVLEWALEGGGSLRAPWNDTAGQVRRGRLAG